MKASSGSEHKWFKFAQLVIPGSRVGPYWEFKLHIWINWEKSSEKPVDLKIGTCMHIQVVYIQMCFVHFQQKWATLGWSDFNIGKNWKKSLKMGQIS